MNALKLRMAVVLALLAAGGTAAAQAPSWSAEQAAVWKVVQESWQKDQEKDLSWMDQQVLGAASMWHEHMPAPRNAAANRRWANYYNEHYTMLIHQLSPQAISIDGDTALAHYHWSAVYEHGDEKDQEAGRCSDTLVRRDGSWRWLGWSCAGLE